MPQNRSYSCLSSKLSFYRISLSANILLTILVLFLLNYCPDKNHYVQITEISNPSLTEGRDRDFIIKGTRYTQRGEFWVLENYIMGTETFSFNESITFTTHGDFTYLDNLIPLLERWNGPVSMSVYTPGSDFNEALTRIIYLRECSKSSLVKKFVSFHFYFEYKHFPKIDIPKRPSYLTLNCSLASEPISKKESESYKYLHKLTYPINIGRNVAREMAMTEFVLPADIELYPSPDLIPEFFLMIKSNSSFNYQERNQVFVLPIFEVESYVTRLPEDKQQLALMLKNGSAVFFHQLVCDYCHKIPKLEEWIAAADNQYDYDLKVFLSAKRKGDFVHWEPIYISRNEHLPFYDERLNREGLKDKMTQGYALCLMNYDFNILNNAFLIHRPGIRRSQNGNQNTMPAIRKQNKVIDQILPELKQLYGNSHSKKCEA